MTGGEKAIGDVAVKGHHLSSGLGRDMQVPEKAVTFPESHYYGQLFNFYGCCSRE